MKTSRDRIALIAALAVVAAALLSAGTAAARCLPWAPDTVTLVGELEMRSLPGPPGYRHIARGDNPQDVYFIKLEKPICVNEDLESSLPRESHSGIMKVQLSTSSVTLNSLVGRRVSVSGTLFSGNSRHYRTPVALDVTAIRGG